MKSFIVTRSQINSLAAELLSKNWSIFTQSEDRKRFKQCESESEISVDGDRRPSDVSFKELFFPKSETLFYFKRDNEELTLLDPAEPGEKTVIFGAKPCDAASIPVLSKVFNWDYNDEFFNKRVENTIVISIACSYSDESCFCTSVGLSPFSEIGSDLFLIPTEKNSFILKIVSEKGEKLLSEFPFMIQKEFEGTFDLENQKASFPKEKFDFASVKEWLGKNFKDEIWNEVGELCLGCAQCAYVCPTCHCFDIVDENCGVSCGRRVKNWDSCQFGLFTKHASGHNPREDQSRRYRQRVNHKFNYYKQRFDEILCTGCGRCTRGCPVSIDIAQVLEKIQFKQSAAIV
jgi:ferredoxin